MRNLVAVDREALEPLTAGTSDTPVPQLNATENAVMAPWVPGAYVNRLCACSCA